MTPRIRIGTLYVQGLATLTAILGLISILSAATPALQPRLVLLNDMVSPLVQQEAAQASVLIGFALLILARGLWQRKRSGWVLTVGLLGVSVVLHLLKGLDYEEAILSALLMLGLLATYRQFHTKSDAPSTWLAFVLMGLSVIVTLIYGTVGFTWLSHHIEPNMGIVANVQNTLRLFFAPAALTVQTTSEFGLFFIQSVYVIFLVGMTSALILLLRSVIVRQSATQEERRRARQIIEEHGQSSVAYFALLEDKSYYFSDGGSVIAYVVKNNIALALGDPIGAEEDIVNAIHEFKQFAQANGWQVAFYQVLPDYLDYYQAATLRTLPIGQEAVINLIDFSLSGGARKALRQHYNRAQKRGYTARIHQPPFAHDMLDTLKEISDEWLAEIQGVEKRFSLGWFYEAYLQDNPIMAVYNADGDLCAFANILPEYNLNEATIDMMRSRNDVESGVMDFLFVSLFLWAKEQGYSSFNLGLVALVGIGDEPGDSRIERGLHYLFEHLNQFYNFKGLFEFKSKFKPEWQDRYLVYPNALALPAVAIALVRADSGDDFIWTYFREWRLEQQAQRRKRRAEKQQGQQDSQSSVESASATK